MLRNPEGVAWEIAMITKFVAGSLVGAMLALSSQFAVAQAPGQGNLPASDISAFRANPGQLLTQFPGGGPQMKQQLRNLLTSDRTTLGTIIGLARNATQDQRVSMGEVLAEVAKSYAASDPAFANQIQQAVAASGVAEFARAYAEAAGDTGTAAAGGGGGGGGGTGGGGPNTAGAPTGGNNTGNNATGNNATQTQANGLTSASLGTIGGTTEGTTGTTTTTTNTFTTTTNTTVTEVSTF
jgi:hypothetical protein